MSSQETLKQQGNNSFKEQKYEEAINFYTQAIACDPNVEACGAVYSNRAACFQALGRFQEALQDADDCIRVHPNWVKGHHRKGLALEALDQLAEAHASFANALKNDPSHVETAAKMKKLVARLKSSMGLDAALFTPLFQAIIANDSGTVEQMLADNKTAMKLLKEPDPLIGQEPLLFACARASFLTVKLIMDKINSFNDEEFTKQRLLFVSLKAQHTLDHFLGQTVLESACSNANHPCKIVRLLLEKYEGIGKTPLVKEILFKKSNKGITPLSRAIMYTHSNELINLLIDTCRNVEGDVNEFVGAKNEKDQSVMVRAICSANSPDVAEYVFDLLEKVGGEPLLKRIFEERYEKTDSLFTLAIRLINANDGPVGIIDVIVKKCRSIGGNAYLREQLESMSHNQDTPLTFALRSGVKLEIIKTLIEAGKSLGEDYLKEDLANRNKINLLVPLSFALIVSHGKHDRSVAEFIVNTYKDLGGDEYLIKNLEVVDSDKDSLFMAVCRMCDSDALIDFALDLFASLDDRYPDLNLRKRQFWSKSRNKPNALHLLLRNDNISTESRDKVCSAMVDACVYNDLLDDLDSTFLSELPADRKVSLERQQFSWLTNIAKRYRMKITHKVIDSFREQEVDKEIFLLLTDDSMKELGLPVVARINLLHLIKKEKENQQKLDSAAAKLTWLDNLYHKHFKPPANLPLPKPFSDRTIKMLIDQEIDEDAFPLLTQAHIENMGIDVGPMVKMLHIIEKIKSTAQNNTNLLDTPNQDANRSHSAPQQVASDGDDSVPGNGVPRHDGNDNASIDGRPCYSSTVAHGTASSTLSKRRNASGSDIDFR